MKSKIFQQPARARVLVAMRQFSKAAATIAAVQQQFSADAEALLTLAELNESVGNESAASEAYEQALRNATGATELRVRYAFGGFAASRKDYARAAELWKPLIDRNKPDMLLDSYARALYNSRNLQELAAIASHLKAGGLRVSARFAEVAASACQRLDDLQDAAYWLEYTCNNYGNKPEYIVALANVKLRLGQRAQAIELLDASKATLKDARDVMGYAQAYSMLGRHEDAIELATRAVGLAQDPEIHMASIGVFLAAPDSVKRTQEQIAAHQDVMAKFKERFPESKLLQSFKVDPERPLDAIQATLERHSKQVQEVLAAYKQQPMPLQMFAGLLGKDLYDTWLAIISTPDMALRSGGTEEDLANAQRLLETSTAFIIEPVALFTLCFLGHGADITKIGDIHIAQKALDYLHEMEAKKAVRESGTMGMIDGRFFIEEVTPEQLQKRNAALRCSVTWAEELAKPVGLKEPLSSDEKRALAVLGPTNVATLAIARQRGMVLVTDDKTLADVAKNDFGVSSVNTQSALLYLEQRNQLTQGEYDRAVVKLLEVGYSVTVYELQLFGVVAEEQFQITPRLKRVLGILAPANSPLRTVSAIAAGLIRRVFLEPLPDEIRSQLVFFILETIAENHPKIQVQRLIRGFLRQQMRPLLALQLHKIELLLDRW